MQTDCLAFSFSRNQMIGRQRHVRALSYALFQVLTAQSSSELAYQERVQAVLDVQHV